MGGSNDDSNLIELTIEEHANAHRLLYERYNKEEDYLAWQALSAQIGHDEITYRKNSIGGKNNKGRVKSPEHRQKISQSLKRYWTENPRGLDYREFSHTDESRSKISKSMIGNTSSKNHSSGEYKSKQSIAMKLAWEKRKNKNGR